MRVAYQRFGGLSPALMNRAPRYEAELAPKVAAVARRLVPAEFFSLGSTASERRRPDMFLHEIVVEDEGREHRVVLSDEDITPALRPFVEWLQDRAGVS
jgi:Emfourin